ncbi:MAG: hypothetical protein GON13_03800 [Nanoarchaeota archaeon]|nr:hypothetical protein [Nanoarchaeota archaeon]
MKIKKNHLILLATLFSGMAALIYEISWIRPIQMLLGSTVYTVSIIFACFMLGLGLGSIISTKLLKKIDSYKLLMFIQFCIAITAMLSLMTFNFMPLIYKQLTIFYYNFEIFMPLLFLLVFVIISIPTILMGMTWPVFVDSYKKKDVKTNIGELYSFNNFGAVIGASITSLLLIPFIGVNNAVLFGGVLNLLAFSMLAAFNKKTIILIPFAFLILVGVSTFSNYDVYNIYENGFYRALLFEGEPLFSQKILFHDEGLYATIDVVEEGGEVRSLLINGKGQGGTSVTDMRVNYLLAYLPLLLHDNPSNALIIGLGTGTTAGHLAISLDTSVVEIEPLILDTIEFFSDVNRDVLNNNNIELVFDDGRNYLLKSKENFDIIIPEPSDPWQDFSSSLFSKEFFELSKRHLNENGLFVQWIPVYELSISDFKSFYATFNSVFQNILIFANVRKEERQGPYPTELILVGSDSEFVLENIAKNFYLLDSESREMLSSVILHSSLPKFFESEDAADRIEFLLMFADEDLHGYSDNVQLITDDKPLLEFSVAKNIFRVDREGVVNDLISFIVGDDSE